MVVADDFPLVRDGLVRALDSDPGIEVVGQAEDGAHALELAQQLNPDVMTLDLGMPGMDGLQVLEAVRTSGLRVVVIIVTASEDASTLLDAVAAGAAGYLSKRSTGKELRQAVLTAHAGGSLITPSLAGHLLKEFSSAARGEASQIRPLQGRELDVLRLVVHGKTDIEISIELFISPRTVQNTLAKIRAKTGLRRRSELTRWAVEHSIV